MSRVIRGYGKNRPRCLAAAPQLHAAVDSLVSNALQTDNRFVSSDNLTWADVADDYAEAADSPPPSPPPRHGSQERVGEEEQPRSKSAVQRCLQAAEEARQVVAAAKEKTLLAAMARRRKASKKNSSSAKLERHTEALLIAAKDWARLERSKEGEGKPCILVAPKIDRPPAKRRRGGGAEGEDVRFRDLCLAAIKEGADAAMPDATGAAALLYLASINVKEAHQVLKACILQDVDLTEGHLLGGKGVVDVALEAGNVWAVRAFLSRGASPLVAPAKGEGCCSLIEFAALHGFVKQAAITLGQRLFSALDDAAPGAVAAVLLHGITPHVRDSSGRTPLLRCVEEGLGLACAKELLKKGADPNVRDACGVPTAMFAIIRQDKAMFAELARHGLDPSIREEVSGDTIREAASSSGWSEKELASLFPAPAAHDTPPSDSPSDSPGRESPARPARRARFGHK